METYDFIIIGSGFKALSTAYYFQKQNKRIKVIYDSNNFYGTLSSIPVNNDKIDLGYHFFDGLNNQSETFIRNMCNDYKLHNFGYGAATYTNSKLTADLAITHFGSFGFYFTVKNFFKLLFTKFNINKINIKNKSLEEFFSIYPKQIREFIYFGIKRNYAIEPKLLSYRAKNYSPISYERISLINSKFTSLLKKINFFDDRFACKRKDLRLTQISLYPKGSNMNEWAQYVKTQLQKKGVEFEFSKKINILNYEKDLRVETDNGHSSLKKLIYLKDLDSAINFFNIKFDNLSNYAVPQILFIFEQKNIISKFQYVMGNDQKLLVSRGTNLSLYSRKSKSGNAYILAEVPVKTTSKVWNAPENFVMEVWENLIKMGLSKKNENFINYKCIKASKTFSLPTKFYNNNLDKFEKFLLHNFHDKVKIIGMDLIGRHDFIINLLENNIND